MGFHALISQFYLKNGQKRKKKKKRRRYLPEEKKAEGKKISATIMISVDEKRDSFSS